MSRPEDVRIPSFVYAASGASAGAVQTGLWHPLDLLKTRLQVQGSRVNASGLPAYRSLPDAFATIIRLEGAAGFFRGVTPNVVGSALAWGLQMPLYAQFKNMLGNDSAQVRPALAQATCHLACSFAAGAVTNVLVHPFFFVKTRMQLQFVAQGRDPLRPDATMPLYRNTADALMNIVRGEGVLGLYRGFAASLLLCSHGAFLLASYDHFKAICPSIIIASSCAKIFATTATYPLQVVRSVMQQRPNGNEPFPYVTFTGTARALWRSGGLLRLYRGIHVQMLRTVPQSVALFSVYEHIISIFTSNAGLWQPAQH